MSRDQDIRDTVMLVWHAAYELEKRPELTETERERVRIAQEILFETAHRVRARFANAGPGSTTFSVLAQ
jgi:hypothetical protein